jgi:hypothetical protein
VVWPVHQPCSCCDTSGAAGTTVVQTYVNWHCIYRALLLLLLPGKFSWSAPLLGCVISFEEPGAVGALDWWGINYYSR